MTITADRAWGLYLEIDANIRQCRHVETKKSLFGLDRALQRLCQAVLIQYDLQKEGYPRVVYYNRTLDVNSIKKLNLTSTRAMINARIIEWEEAREESFYVGSDDDSPGGPGDDYSTRTVPAAFRPQDSIQDCLRLDYAEALIKIRTTAEEALAFFKRIDKCARVEIQRISLYNVTFQKDTQIDLALQRLHQAILHQYNQKKPAHVVFTTAIDKKKVHLLDLYSINSMLNAQVFALDQGVSTASMSLRQALNISRRNPINIISYQEAYWGKAASLESFERAINEEELKPIN